MACIIDSRVPPASMTERAPITGYEVIVTKEVEVPVEGTVGPRARESGDAAGASVLAAATELANRRSRLRTTKRDTEPTWNCGAGAGCPLPVVKTPM
jgi:hypothetical protein